MSPVESQLGVRGPADICAEPARCETNMYCVFNATHISICLNNRNAKLSAYLYETNRKHFSVAYSIFPTCVVCMISFFFFFSRFAVLTSVLMKIQVLRYYTLSRLENIYRRFGVHPEDGIILPPEISVFTSHHGKTSQKISILCISH